VQAQASLMYIYQIIHLSVNENPLIIHWKARFVWPLWHTIYSLWGYYNPSQNLFPLRSAAKTVDLRCRQQRFSMCLKHTWRAFFTSGLAHGLFARSHHKTGFRMSSISSEAFGLVPPTY
jgi:hypothetical protein